MLVIPPQANVVVEGRCCYPATAKIGNIFDIFQRHSGSSSTAGRDRSAEKCKYKEGFQSDIFYSRQRVTPIVDKIDKFASRHQTIEQTFLRGPVIKDSSFATQVL